MKLVEEYARSHIYCDVLNWLREEGINKMSHPPYSLDLAQCDYWLNDYMKRNLIDQANEKCLARAVSKVVKNISEEEFLRNYSKGWNFE